MSARIRGRAVPLDEAVGAAAALLAQARSPAIVGLHADVDALRAAFALGARIGASFDVGASASLYADLSAFASGGAMTTTESETLMRADLVVAVGPRADSSSLVSIARSTKPKIGTEDGARRVMSLAAGNHASLAAAVAMTRAQLSGRLAGDDPVAKAIGGARFCVLVYDPADLCELGIEMLQGLAMDANVERRAFTLSLDDGTQGRAALQVSTWTTGAGPRFGVGAGVPLHDPWRFDASRQAIAGEIDAALWLSPLPAPRPDWLAATRSICILGGEEAAAEVLIEAGIPGVTHGGVLWDDRRGTLAYVPAREPSDRPNAAAIVRAIEAALARHEERAPQ